MKTQDTLQIFLVKEELERNNASFEYKTADGPITGHWEQLVVFINGKKIMRVTYEEQYNGLMVEAAGIEGTKENLTAQEAIDIYHKTLKNKAPEEITDGPQQVILPEPAVRRGNYECFHCCTRGVIWQSDFDFSDFGYEGEGIVHICQCANCGAEIEYRVPFSSDEEEADNE